MAFLKSGSPGGTRTPDQLVNSQLLYRLSYRGRNFVLSYLLGSYFNLLQVPRPRVIAIL